MKHSQYIPMWRPHPTLSWRRYAGDTLLAIAAIGLVAFILAATSIFPRIPSSRLTVMLAIMALASARGHYAGILAALLASVAIERFPDLAWGVDANAGFQFDDVLDPVIFLASAIATGQLAAVLRGRTEQARRSEREALLHAEQAEELAALRERQRLARELHDSVAQSLYGINLGAHTAREALTGNAEEVMAPLEYVIELSEAALADMRALIFELRPESLATEGLIVALNKQVEVLRTHYKLEVEAQLCAEPALAIERKQALYRIVQEALHNIVKHARARAVRLQLDQRDGELILTVCDDGIGFDPAEAFPGHLGIHSIRERAAWLGGDCSIESSPSRGTSLRVRLPLRYNLAPAGARRKPR